MVIVCMIILYILSVYIWDVKITGTMNYTEQQLLKYMEENFVPLGKKKKVIDCNLIEESIMEDFNGVAWVSCDIKGTRLNVTIKETVEDKTLLTDKPSDIVANKEGQITSI